MKPIRVAALAAAFAVPAAAQTQSAPRVDPRPQNQERRIYRQKHDRQGAK